MALHRAVLQSDLAKVQSELSNPDCDVNKKDGETMTALHWAAAYNDSRILKIMLSDARIDVNARNKRQHTPLHTAACHDAAAAVELLLSNDKCEIDALNQWHETPLSLSCAAGNIACVRLLLKRGASFEIRNQWGDSPLDIATAHQEKAVVNLLTAFQNNGDLLEQSDGEEETQETKCKNLEKSNQINEQDNCKKETKLKSFVLSKLMEMPLSDESFVAWLSNQEMDVNSADYYGMTPLHKLAAWNKAHLIGKLLQHRHVDVKQLLQAKSSSGDTPLHCAAMMHSDLALRALGEWLHSNTDTAFQTLLLTATPNNDKQTTLDIIEQVFNSDDDDRQTKKQLLSLFSI